MALSESDIIRRYFNRPGPASNTIPLGIGDDAALLRLGGDRTATLRSVAFPGPRDTRHGPAALGPLLLERLGSSCRSAGLRPIGLLLNLSLPELDEDWLEPFADGLLAAADGAGLTLVGGDTVRGPLAIDLGCVAVKTGP